jgi:cation:H+ antiporter
MIAKMVFGFALLFGGAEFMVRGAVALAKRLGVSTLVIGMTVVAMGTSAPELIVSLNAALSSAEGLAVGNVVGSNIANILLILGVSALIAPIMVRPEGMMREGVLLLAGSLVFTGLAWRGTFDLFAGAVLSVLFVGFLFYSYYREKRGNQAADIHIQEVEDVGNPPKTNAGIWAAIIGGTAGLIIGSELLVDGGVGIARQAGVSEEVIGLTLIAFGTSLPELAASAMSARRGHAEVALGNVVGSNLFNLLLVIGAVAMVRPLPVADQIMRFDLGVMLVATVALLPILSGGRTFGRIKAALFLAAYGAYIGAQVYGVRNLISWY